MVPDVNREYEKYNSNQSGLIVLEIHKTDSEAKTIEWANQYDCKYPVISGEKGGSSVYRTYRIEGTPTLILIAPDQKVVEQDIWGIEELAPTLEKYTFTGIKQNMAFNPSDFAIGKVNSQKITITIPVDGGYNLSLYSANGKMIANLFDMYMTKGEHAISWDKNRFAKGVFLIQLRQKEVIKTKKVIMY